MKELLPVGCVIMASGASRRFGSNKLLAQISAGNRCFAAHLRRPILQGFRPASW